MKHPCFHKRKPNPSATQRCIYIDANDEIEIVLSSVIHRDDQDVEDEINELNKKLKNLCKGKGRRFIDNSNIKSSSLNSSKLHLNKRGTALLTTSFAKIVHPD